MSAYEMAQKIVGEVPPQYEFIYAIVCFFLLLMILYVLSFPITFLKGVMGK